MKKNIPMPVAVGVILVALAVLVYFASTWSSQPVANGDVRPVIAEMNKGKPATDPVPPEIAAEGTASRGR
jgi:hypothetical protein